MNQSVTLTLDLVNATLTYLGKRPFEEVQGLISAIQQQAQASMQTEQAEQAEQAEEKPKK